MDSCTTILLVQTLSITQTTEGWLQQTFYLRGVGVSKGGCWPSKGTGLKGTSW